MIQSIKCLMSLPSPIGCEADSKKDCNVLLFCTVYSKSFVCGFFFLVFLLNLAVTLYAYICTMCPTLPHVPINNLYGLTSGAEVELHHGVKAVTNKT